MMISAKNYPKMSLRGTYSWPSTSSENTQKNIVEHANGEGVIKGVYDD